MIPMIITSGLTYMMPNINCLLKAIKDNDTTAMNNAADIFIKLIDKYNLENYSFIPLPEVTDCRKTTEILNIVSSIRNIKINNAIKIDETCECQCRKDIRFIINDSIYNSNSILCSDIIGSGSLYFSVVRAINKNISLIAMCQSQSNSYYESRLRLNLNTII